MKRKYTLANNLLWWHPLWSFTYFILTCLKKFVSGGWWPSGKPAKSHRCWHIAAKKSQLERHETGLLVKLFMRFSHVGTSSSTLRTGTILNSTVDGWRRWQFLERVDDGYWFSKGRNGQNEGRCCRKERTTSRWWITVRWEQPNNLARWRQCCG